jgi:hypothetical protein
VSSLFFVAYVMPVTGHRSTAKLMPVPWLWTVSGRKPQQLSLVAENAWLLKLFR